MTWHCSLSCPARVNLRIDSYIFSKVNLQAVCELRAFVRECMRASVHFAACDSQNHWRLHFTTSCCWIWKIIFASKWKLDPFLPWECGGSGVSHFVLLTVYTQGLYSHWRHLFLSPWHTLISADIEFRNSISLNNIFIYFVIIGSFYHLLLKIEGVLIVLCFLVQQITSCLISFDTVSMLRVCVKIYFDSFFKLFLC